jgi:probable phosphoglycerate mutase
MTTVYLIRHGEIPQSKPRRFVGRQDLPLTDKGREQIALLADFLAARSIDRVLTSPLSRCRESAGILCDRLKLEAAKEVPDLREIGLGAWEGLSVDEVRRRFPGDHEARGRDLTRFQPPGGESFARLVRRAWPAFQAVTASGGARIAVVGHAGVNRVLLCRILGIPLDKLFRLEQHYGCVNIVHRDETAYRVESINTCPWRMAS